MKKHIMGAVIMPKQNRGYYQGLVVGMKKIVTCWQIMATTASSFNVLEFGPAFRVTGIPSFLLDIYAGILTHEPGFKSRGK